MFMMKYLILEYIRKLDNLKLVSVKFGNPERPVRLDVGAGR